MTQAAFQATYSDWRLIKGRKVVQVVFEVPLEGAGQAYDALGGMPDPSKEVWCAVARLNTNGKEATTSAEPPLAPKPAPEADNASPVRVPTRLSEKPYDQQAGILCSNMKFRRFLAEHDKAPGILIYDVDTAVQRVRDICDVQSRTEIRPSTRAEQRWLLLVSAYEAWNLAPSVGAA